MSSIARCTSASVSVRSARLERQAGTTGSPSVGNALALVAIELGARARASAAPPTRIVPRTLGCGQGVVDDESRCRARSTGSAAAGESTLNVERAWRDRRRRRDRARRRRPRACAGMSRAAASAGSSWPTTPNARGAPRPVTQRPAERPRHEERQVARASPSSRQPEAERRDRLDDALEVEEVRLTRRLPLQCSGEPAPVQASAERAAFARGRR